MRHRHFPILRFSTLKSPTQQMLNSHPMPTSSAMDIDALKSAHIPFLLDLVAQRLGRILKQVNLTGVILSVAGVVLHDTLGGEVALHIDRQRLA